jgi:hypothetical protein
MMGLHCLDTDSGSIGRAAQDERHLGVCVLITQLPPTIFHKFPLEASRE